MTAKLSYAAFALLCLLAVTGPGFRLVANVTWAPWGVPFPIVWSAVWIGASFVALLAYDRAGGADR